MIQQQSSLRVTSHVARDLLQSAGLFHHAQNVIWEYVSNGLQYVDPGVQPIVQVSVSSSPKKIAISDNGTGMSLEGLRRFFQMHGENQERAAGRPGRGYFGTGKSAAFAIADLLRITTVRDGKKCVVELHRGDVDATSSGAEVPVREICLNQSVISRNGTIIEIEKLHNVRLDRQEITRTLERHIRYLRRGAIVELDGRRVERTTPPLPGLLSWWVATPNRRF